MDLHADQIQGFSNPGGQRLRLAGVAWGCVEAAATNMIVVSPDVGGVVRARALAKRLDDADLAIIDKRRPRPNESKVMNIIGEVKGKNLRPHRRHGRYRGYPVPGGAGVEGRGCGEGGGVHHARRAVRQRGGKIAKSALDELVVTDTIPLSAATKVRQDPSAVRRGPARRDHPPHPRRGVRELAVCGLSGSMIV